MTRRPGSHRAWLRGGLLAVVATLDLVVPASKVQLVMRDMRVGDPDMREQMDQATARMLEEARNVRKTLPGQLSGTLFLRIEALFMLNRPEEAAALARESLELNGSGPRREADQVRVFARPARRGALAAWPARGGGPDLPRTA